MEWLDKLMGAAHAIQQEGTLWLLIYFLLVYRRLPLHRGIIKDARQLDDVTIIASVLFPDNWRRPAPAGTVFPLIFASPLHSQLLDQIAGLQWMKRVFTFEFHLTDFLLTFL